jgi:predicted nucleic acid-binding protein
MPDSRSLRAVIDTDVVFEGLTKQGGASGLIIDAWLAGLFQACVSNSVAYEYQDVLSHKLSEARWQEIKPILGTLLARAVFVAIYYSWRPTSPDPADEHIIDCAMNAGAPVVTHNVRHFRLARQTLGLEIMAPVEFVTRLADVPDKDQ